MYLSRRLLKLSTQFEYYGKYQPTPVTLKSLIDFGMSREQKKKNTFFYCYSLFIAVDGDMKHSYKFLRMELLVRWSHMRKEMNYIPTRYAKNQQINSAHI
jgi:hypothetical protein